VAKSDLTIYEQNKNAYQGKFHAASWQHFIPLLKETCKHLITATFSATVVLHIIFVPAFVLDWNILAFVFYWNIPAFEKQEQHPPETFFGGRTPTGRPPTLFFPSIAPFQFRDRDY
jgi:hypothetical protein